MKRTAAFVSMLSLLATLSCSRREAARGPAATPLKSVSAQTSRTDDWESDTLPPRDAYAGSSACRECHATKFTNWQKDWHARALSPATPLFVRGRFDGSHFKDDSTEAWMHESGGGYRVRTRNREGILGDYPVKWLIGGKRMQDAVTVFDDGRWQVLPVYFHVTGKGAWVDYNEAKQGTVGPDHPFFWTNFRRTANHECLNCHTTGLDVRYDDATHSWHTDFADNGVACESCHGPGARHAETKAKSDIVRADHLDPDRQMAVCAQCHGPREPLFPQLDSKHRFHPGDRYDDKFQPLVITDATDRSGEFFADGRPNSSSFEYQALVQSSCYRNGKATCLSCHTAPHDRHGANDLKLFEKQPELASTAIEDRGCRSCHAAIFSAVASHTHHQTPAGQSCVGCHMPRVLSSVLDKFADHSIDIPNPENTTRHAIPNACSTCHEKTDAVSLQATMLRWWPAAAARQARRVRLADAIDERTAAESRTSLADIIRDEREAPTLRGAAMLLYAQRFRDDTSSVVRPFLHSADPLLRSRAAEAIGFAAARDSANDIATLGDDPSLQVQQVAALVLSSLDDSRGEKLAARLASGKESSSLVRPHVILAIASAKRGDLKTAEEELDRACRLVPYLTDALLMRADIHARQGDLSGARKYVDEALRFSPGSRSAKARLAAMGGAETAPRSGRR